MAQRRAEAATEENQEIACHVIPPIEFEYPATNATLFTSPIRRGEAEYAVPSTQTKGAAATATAPKFRPSFRGAKRTRNLDNPDPVLQTIAE
jgi:hypothetical protein